MQATLFSYYMWRGLRISINSIIIFPEQAQSLGFNKFEHWISGIVFLMSFGASFSAIGVFASSITKNQMVAGML